MTSRTRTDALLIAGFCAFLFFYGINQFGLIGADEPRYAQVAREMLAGRDWITPVLGGKPWLEKPPLYYWQAMLAYSIFGVTDWAARVPSGIDATLLVLGVYFFFRRFRRGVELDAALIAASCAGVVGFSRAASMDMALASAFSLGMLAWWAWHERGSRIYLLAFYFFMALGMLAKGPVAPFLAVLVIMLYALLTRQARLVVQTAWPPAIFLFCAVALPWYIAVQLRNPQFFREFILQHNLARFSSDLYHHREPFWFYLPVTVLALFPWIAFVLAAFVRSLRSWLASRRSATDHAAPESRFGFFAACWLILPVIFFSISQSKLPGYVLPAVPAGGLLLADDLYGRLRLAGPAPVSRWLIMCHALLAAAPFVPAFVIASIVLDHHLPAGKPVFVALAIALVLALAIALTLMSTLGLRMLRFVTLIPVILTIAMVLKAGSVTLDETLSARPLAREIASIETEPLRLAVYGVPRELEFGLNFYRNRVIERYERDQVPVGEHLLIAPENRRDEIVKEVDGRRISLLGHYAPQHVDYYWIAAAAAQH